MSARKLISQDGGKAVEHHLSEARAVLSQFHGEGRLQSALKPRAIDDPRGMQGRAIELAAQMSRSSADLGCWMRQTLERGAGICTPAAWAGEGRHLLVLDSRAVAELWERLAIFDRLQADAARVVQAKGRA